MKTCLANQVPFLIGIKLLDSATSEAKRNNGYISMPDPSSLTVAMTGTHAVLVVGYDDRTRHFIVRNSWGRDWGIDGYFYIPYDYLIEKRLINYLDGLWAITDIIPRTNYKPTVRRLVVPGHNHDERRMRDYTRDYTRHHYPHLGTKMMMMRMPTRHYPLQRRLSMPTLRGINEHYWYG
ncbi:unnamed protein product [Adineta ricciae]|nr:unnamed protein product [Adineta ricciae]